MKKILCGYVIPFLLGTLFKITGIIKFILLTVCVIFTSLFACILYLLIVFYRILP